MVKRSRRTTRRMRGGTIAEADAALTAAEDLLAKNPDDPELVRQVAAAQEALDNAETEQAKIEQANAKLKATGGPSSSELSGAVRGPSSSELPEGVGGPSSSELPQDEDPSPQSVGGRRHRRSRRSRRSRRPRKSRRSKRSRRSRRRH